MDLARKAAVLILLGVEPVNGESLESFVKRGEKIVREMLAKETEKEPRRELAG